MQAERLAGQELRIGHGLNAPVRQMGVFREVNAQLAEFGLDHCQVDDAAVDFLGRDNRMHQPTCRTVSLDDDPGGLLQLCETQVTAAEAG